MELGEKLELIERLGRLHAQGAISDEEFAAEKAKLLGGGSPPPASVELTDREPLSPPPPPRAQVTVADEPAPIADHDEAHYGYVAETRHGKWVAIAACLLLVLGGGYWLSQTSASRPADALSDATANSAGEMANGEASISSAQLVGTWTPDDSCISDAGFDLGAEGIVGYEDGSGRWRVEGRDLVTVEEGVRRATPILSVAGDRLALRHADGSVARFRRCSAAQVAAAKAAAEKQASLEAEAAQLEAAGASAAAFSADEQRAIESWMELNSKCRGGSGDETSTMRACEQRDAAGVALERRGICYGRENEAGYQMQHHRCGQDSLRSGT